MSNEEKNELKEEKITWKGWVSLIYLIVAFSGIFAKADIPYRAFDLMALIGKFGLMTGTKVNFVGAGGVGAREGFLFALSLIPTVMLAQGLIQSCEALGALRAGGKLFQPLLKPLMGIPGIAGLAFVSSFNSSDVGAFMTKDMYEKGLMTDDERTVFAAYQYAGSGTIGNVIGAGAPLIPISLLPVGIILGLIIVVKFIGANLVRIALKYYHKKHPEGEVA